jgi:hypothetical protein
MCEPLKAAVARSSNEWRRGGQGGPTRGARAAANRREAWRDGYTSAPLGSVGSCPEHVHLTLRRVRVELAELASQCAALEERCPYSPMAPPSAVRAGRARERRRAVQEIEKRLAA